MTERHARALFLRGQGKTFREIGVELGVTPARVRQMVAHAKRETLQRTERDPDDIEGSQISTRTKNGLLNAGLTTFTQVRGLSRAEFMRLRNCGVSALAQISAIIDGWPVKRRSQ